MNKRHYFYSPLSGLTVRERRVLALYVINECVSTLGRKRNKKVPTIQIRSHDRDAYGYYNELTNVIRVHWDLHKGVGEFVRTIVHEYTHYLQPIKTQYIKLYKKFGYDNHPFEIKARMNEVELGSYILKKFRSSLADSN